MIKIDNIYNMDCLEGMRQMESESVDLTVTSPPYDNLRTYNGYCFDFENIAKELYRVTKQGGVVVWVVGDATIDGSETGTSFRQALYFMECGFKLYDTMLYVKANPIPQNKRRYEQVFEYMFVLSKGFPKTFNPIYEKCKQEGRLQQWGRRTNTTERTAKHLREDDKQKTRELKLHGNAFIYGIGGRTTGHPAPFPEQLAADHIRSWSNEGDIVLDPFMGSGTTAKMALTLNRHYIGFEISAEYCQIIEKRLMPLKTQYKLF